MPQVTTYLYGGTISMVREEGAPPGVEPARLGVQALLPGVDLGGIEVRGESVRAVGSSRMTFEDVRELVLRARAEVLEGRADGVVVVQGTDTLEEVAFLIDLVWDLDAPIVLTGAMRHPGLPGADGPANLAAAVRVAASQGARGRGSLVVLADEVHAGRFVTKGHASRPHAFVSPVLGAFGIVAEGRVRFHARAERQAPLPLPGSMPRDVALHLCTLDEDPALLRAVCSAASGLVVGAFGVGHVRPEVADVLAEAAQRIPVVLCSRTGAGLVHHETYGGPGNERDLLQRGLLDGGRLRPVQARLLLSVLLGLGLSGEDLAAELRTHS